MSVISSPSLLGGLFLSLILAGCAAQPEAAEVSSEPPPSSSAAELLQQVNAMLASNDPSGAASFATSLLESIDALEAAHPGKPQVFQRLRSHARRLGQLDEGEQIAILKRVKLRLESLK